MSTFTPFAEKMESAGVSAAAVNAFSRCYEALVSNHSGMIPETDILPADQVEDWQDITASTPAADKDLISRCVCIKLNGGLGTSMGLQKAKSLLKIKGEDTFLDLIVRQVKHLRSISGTPVRLLLMNSFSTSADTLAYLEKYAADGFADPAQVELMQNRVPKILADGLSPASCPEQPELEWCPPGHGDLYPALLGSGWLDRLLADGVKYAFVSNSDNLGAQLDMNFLRWFAESGAPFVMEVTRRTEADRKGGHLAVRKSDGQLILREVAQCPDEDIPEFQNISRHRYFNTSPLRAMSSDISTNKKARRDYEILDTYECGMELKGTEVKSIRAGKVNIADSFARVENGQMLLYGCDIQPWETAGEFFQHQARRPRRLLLHKREIFKLEQQTSQKGCSLVALKLYWKNGKVKLALGLGKGKTHRDQRYDLKARVEMREAQREVARINRR